MTEKVNGVYLFYNKETDEKYVGSTNDLEGRRKAHERQLRRGEHPNRRFQTAFDRNPNFDYDSVPTRSREEAFDIEQAVVDAYKGNRSLLNISQDVRHCSFVGGTHTEEARRKIGAASKGNTYRLGTKLSDEHRQRISQWNAGRVVSKETREKIVASNLGQKRSPETVERIRQSKTGLIASEETKAKMSQAHLGRPKSETHAENIRRAKQEVSSKVSIDGTVYESIQAASRALGTNPGNVHYRLNSARHPEWKYI